MAAREAEQRRLVAQIAAASRWGNEDPADARRDLAASRLEAYIRRVVDAAPPLTDDQRALLVALLAGGRVT